MGIATSQPRREAAADTVLLSVVVDRASAEPLGRQVYLRIRDLILSGRLAADAKLPSSRKLADDLGVSRTVTLGAYDQLGVEGYLKAARGSGHYVQALDRKPTATARPADIPSAVARDKLPATDTSRIRGRPFDPDTPASSLFPMKLWTRLMVRGWRRDGQAATSFDEWAGLPSLRAAIAGHVRALQGVDCVADQVMITAGNADALQLIARGLGARGERIWVEDPGHIGARKTLEREGMKVVPVAVDSEGLDVEAGRRLAPKARFALVTPSRQFPSGAPLSLRRRVAIIDWAHENDALVIADDYDSELRFSGRPMATLSSLDSGGAVLSIGSFTKVTFPGLRLGYIVGPTALIARLVEARALDGVPVATGSQPALAEFIASGGLAQHLRRLRLEMGHRRRALADALQARLGDAVSIRPQEVGMHLAVTLNGPLSAPGADLELAALAAARGLNLDALSKHAAADEGHQGFVLGYAGWDETALAAGVEDLAQILADFGRRAIASQSPGRPSPAVPPPGR